MLHNKYVNKLTRQGGVAAVWGHRGRNSGSGIDTIDREDSKEAEVKDLAKGGILAPKED